MAHVVVVGAGIGGMSAAFELREVLGKKHPVTLIGEGSLFSFTPSNPWVAVGWRTPEKVQLPVLAPLQRKGIRFINSGVSEIDAANNRVRTGSGEIVDYDYLVIATGPALAFDEVPGLGPDGETQSICTTPHAQHAWDA